MITEILYNDYFLFGDSANVTYLQKCIPDGEFIFTAISDRPYFADNEPDLIYMGAMSESNQERVIKALSPYKDRLCELIGKGVHMLFTANSCDILGNYIKDGDRMTDGLGIFNFHVIRRMMKRFNGMTLGTFNDIEIVGYMSQFGLAYPDDSADEHFFKVTRGSGLNPECGFEGFRKNNLTATYLIGPFLIINPKFTKYLIKDITGADAELPFEKEAMECYEKRLAEFKDPARKII